MKNYLRVAGAVILIVAALSGCRTLFGRGHGPVDAFAFLPENNPGLARAVTGLINEASDPKTVEMVVPPGTNTGNLVATISLNTEATIQVVSSGSAVDQQNSQSANNFQSPVLYSIKTPKDKEPWLYRVVVREAETNARLSSLRVVDGSSFEPPFNPGTGSYSTTVPYASTQITVEAEAQSRHLQKIVIDGREVRGSRASVAIPFSGTDRLDVTVTAVAEDQTTQSQYAVTVVRGEPDRNSSLGSLSIRDAVMSPVFSPNRVNYSAQVPYATSALQVTAAPQSRYTSVAFAVATAQSGLASIAAQGDPRSANGARIDFSNTDHLTLVVISTAQDGSSSQYSVNITRAAPDRNNSLQYLEVPGSNLSPAFDPNRLYYSVEVPFNAQQFSLAAVAQSSVATVSLAGSSSNGDLGSVDGAAVRFTGIDRMQLGVRVTAQDGSVLVYTLDVRRGPPDNNAELSNLIATPGRLSPTFSPRIATYSVSIGGSTPAANILVQTASPYASVATSAAGVAQNGSGPNGKVFSVPVNPGQVRSLDLVVTAQDGTQRLYRVNVARESAPVQQSTQPAPKDGNSLLSGIVVAGAQLQPAFSPNRQSYEVTVPTSQNRVTLFPIAQSPTSRVAIDGQPVGREAQTIQLQPGTPRVVVIDVMAENGATTRYTVKMTRELPPASRKPVEHPEGDRDQKSPVSQQPPGQHPEGNGGQQQQSTDHQGGQQQQPPVAQRQPVRMVVLVKSDAVRVDPHVWKLVRDAKDQLGNQAVITIRVSGSNQVLAQGFANLQVRQPGNSPAEITFRWTSQPVSAIQGQAIDVSVAIKTEKGKYLSYTESDASAAGVTVDVGAFQYNDSP
ncbi:MAG TPA: cadherin-like beta sandwich domain-containing protein [Spirochaetia bacterium]|nr:cadherin-like beta sandwich domain-containing protein [Spirochaetia bacterium]